MVNYLETSVSHFRLLIESTFHSKIVVSLSTVTDIEPSEDPKNIQWQIIIALTYFN